MKHKVLVAALIGVVVLAGCAVRSISNSGYQESGGWGARSRVSSNPFYKGELSEFDVIGVDPKTPASESAIQAALKSASAVSLRKGDSILVAQSGALIPDEPMITALSRYFNVTVLSGVPPERSTNSGSAEYSSVLRLSAAKAGCTKAVVYWGLLESGQRNLATKTISWFPIVGSVVPDQTQEMRIRLKVAVVDVASGQWTTYMPAGFDDSATSSSLGRESSDQSQVLALKAKSYAAAVEDLVKRYVK
ncbi:MAG: hypothetical protein K1X48_02500 [Burkholderiaceae bacterium]|nr:hypothetical protein [Burkholderiaceae bacterium]